MAPSSTERRSDARMVREVVSTMPPAEASTMQRNNSVGGSHSAKRVLPLVGLDEYGRMVPQVPSLGALLHPAALRLFCPKLPCASHAQARGGTPRLRPSWNRFGALGTHPHRRAREDDSPYRFISTRGIPLERRSYWDLMQKYGRVADIPKAKRCFQALRHATAVHLLDAGADVAFVQDRLGHANIQNTMVYMRYTTVIRDAQTRQLFASHRVV